MGARGRYCLCKHQEQDVSMYCEGGRMCMCSYMKKLWPGQLSLYPMKSKYPNKLLGRAEIMCTCKGRAGSAIIINCATSNRPGMPGICQSLNFPPSALSNAASPMAIRHAVWKIKEFEDEVLLNSPCRPASPWAKFVLKNYP